MIDDFMVVLSLFVCKLIIYLCISSRFVSLDILFDLVSICLYTSTSIRLKETMSKEIKMKARKLTFSAKCFSFSSHLTAHIL